MSGAERLALFWEEDGQARYVPIPEVGALYVGRDPECDVAIPDGALSRRHAMVLGRGGRAYLRHLSKTNGTYLNGKFVASEVELHAGDELWLPVALVRVVRLEDVESRVGD